MMFIFQSTRTSFSQIHSIGRMNGQTKRFSKKILAPDEIASIPLGIIVRTNGTTNGCPIWIDWTQKEVSQWSRSIEFVPFCPDDRPFVFVIPPPYLVAPNATDQENYQWKIVDQIQNETDHDDDPVEKRTVIFVFVSLHVVRGQTVVIHRSFGDLCRRILLAISNKSVSASWLDRASSYFNHLLRFLVVNDVSFHWYLHLLHLSFSKGERNYLSIFHLLVVWFDVLLSP